MLIFKTLLLTWFVVVVSTVIATVIINLDKIPKE